MFLYYYMALSRSPIELWRELVQLSYDTSKKANDLAFVEGDTMATKEYVFPNQKEDALNIVNMFYTLSIRVASVQKKTKVGADGLMIELVKLFTTHPDDNFIISRGKIRILTGMSNCAWEKDMKEKVPDIFRDIIFHHGKLKKSHLTDLTNALIIIDEIDSGSKDKQRLQKILKDAGVLDKQYMEEKNIRFVFISATMIKELKELYQWGDLHKLYTMTIPDEYIGHKEFIERDIIQEWYPLNTVDAAERWIDEDIINYYENDHRIHLVRVTDKTREAIRDACIKKGVTFLDHTSDDRRTHDELKKLFEEKKMEKHCVLAVKGFFRRANLIPNKWKFCIGATMELYTKKQDNNVQVQGLPGRLTGYWKSYIMNGHKTGPYRTSLKSIDEYLKLYEDPFGNHAYQTAGFKQNNRGKITTSVPGMLHPDKIDNLESLGVVVNDINIDRYRTKEEAVNHIRQRHGTEPRDRPPDADGYYRALIKGESKIWKLLEIESGVYRGASNNGYWFYPCYEDPSDKETLLWLVITPVPQ